MNDTTQDETTGRLTGLKGGFLLREDGVCIAATSCPSTADASRLAACWNACEGMETEKLEKLPRPFAQLLAPEFLTLVDELAAMREDLNDARRGWESATEDARDLDEQLAAAKAREAQLVAAVQQLTKDPQYRTWALNVLAAAGAA